MPTYREPPARGSEASPSCTASAQRSTTTCTCTHACPTASSCRLPPKQRVTPRRRSRRPGQSLPFIWPRSGSGSFSIRKTCLTPSGQLGKRQLGKRQLGKRQLGKRQLGKRQKAKGKRQKAKGKRDSHRLLTQTEPIPAAAAAAEAPASLPRGVCVESQAEAGRHGTGNRQRQRATGGHERRAWERRLRHGGLL